MCGILRIQLELRPLRIFDATNQEHRQDYLTFIKTTSLGSTKYRYVPLANGSVIEFMKEELLKYYTGLEFNESR